MEELEYSVAKIPRSIFLLFGCFFFFLVLGGSVSARCWLLVATGAGLTMDSCGESCSTLEEDGCELAALICEMFLKSWALRVSRRCLLSMRPKESSSLRS